MRTQDRTCVNNVAHAGHIVDLINGDGGCVLSSSVLESKRVFTAERRPDLFSQLLRQMQIRVPS